MLPSLIIDCNRIVSGKLQVILIIFSFILRYLDFVFFKNGHKFLDVINVYCCFLTLFFVLPRYFDNVRSHQYIAVFYSTEVFALTLLLNFVF